MCQEIEAIVGKGGIVDDVSGCNPSFGDPSTPPLWVLSPSRTRSQGTARSLASGKTSGSKFESIVITVDMENEQYLIVLIA